MGRDRFGVKYSFGKSAARRLADAARFVEQQPRNRAPDPTPPVQFAGLAILVVTVACNPRSGNTPGSNGRGKIQKLPGSSYSDHSSTAVPILNDFDKTLGVGSFAQCLPGPGGKYHLINPGSCSNLS
jgi:hypothetical protein